MTTSNDIERRQQGVAPYVYRRKRRFRDKAGEIVSIAAKRGGAAAERVVTGAVSAVVGAVRHFGEAVGTFAEGIRELVTGNFPRGRRKIGLALVRVVQTAVDALLMGSGTIVSAVQTLLGIEPRGRGLTSDEIATLSCVFADSVDCRRIRIKEGNAGVLTLPNRPFVHGDTIYVPRDWLPMTKGLLVHEVAHVWQHQHGGTNYMSESLFAQSFGDGYDYAKALREGKKWSELNPEQQAEIVETSFECGLLADPGARFGVDGQDYTDEVRAMIAEMRAGRGAP
jgi:hypothetical protein